MPSWRGHSLPKAAENGVMSVPNGSGLHGNSEKQAKIQGHVKTVVLWGVIIRI